MSRQSRVDSRCFDTDCTLDADYAGQHRLQPTAAGPIMSRRG
jgi:hypothetical protein